ncbi:YybS family protein [Clostridium niameyense]|uniref:YybS family protein n=1 Tax=Clostridium niameyense TaxID=1622073 RepID=UPI00067E6628|nr:YybS family protein [Clostridium niameyense]
MYNRQGKTKSLVEAGLTVALMVVLVLANLYIPVFGTIVSFILPIPITVLYLRQDCKNTILSIVCTGVIVSLLNNPLIGISTTISFGIMGIVLGYCIKKDKSFLTTIIYLAIGFLISTIIKFSMYFLFVDRRGIIAFINDYIKVLNETMDMYKQIYTKAGVPQEKIQYLEKSMAIFKPEYIVKFIPGVLIVASFISGFLNYIITKAILNKLGYKNIKSPIPFSKIYINVRLAAILSIILLIGILLNRKNLSIGDYLMVSSQIILQILFIIDGLSVAIYYLRNKFNISKGLLFVIILFTMFSNLSIIYIFIGLLDIVMDFRKLDPYRLNNNKNGGL